MKYHWYKLESHFGPGHQGTEIRYFYSSSVLNRVDRKEEERAECDRIASRYDTQCITRLRKVQTVPVAEVTKMRDDANWAISRNKRILEALDSL